ncbi:MAG: hypothetical protein ACON4Q_01270, partial [Candidatus Puniceispirillaceae bacterium]
MKCTTVFSMLGGRASVVEAHLNSIKKNWDDRFIYKFLLPPKNRKKTLDIALKYSDVFDFIRREDIVFNEKFPDGTYDTLMTQHCKTRKFLLLHDDTIIEKPSLQTDLISTMKQYEFG